MSDTDWEYPPDYVPAPPIPPQDMPPPPVPPESLAPPVTDCQCAYPYDPPPDGIRHYNPACPVHNTGT